MLDYLVQGLTIALSFQNLLFMLFGTVLGLVFAAIPGLTFSTALILLIPLTFGLEAVPAISVLLGVYAGGMSGGSISAILLGIPGTPSAAATVIDGYAMAKKGEAGKALGMAVYASVFGGIFSLLVLMLVAPQLASVAIKFGPPEIFALVVFGLSTIVSLSGTDIVKGLLAGLFGLLLCTVGLDPVMGLQRYTFGQAGLMVGIGIMPVMIGMFALPEIIDTFLRAKKNQGLKQEEPKRDKVKAAFPSFKEMGKTFFLLIKSAAIGTGLGAIPGTGGPVASFLAYDQAKRTNPLSGTGTIEGVGAPESANNGVTGGALIPLLTLGIPGDSATAIMLGAFLIHGLAPGPLLFQNYGDLVYAIFISILIIYIMVLVIQFYGIRLFVKVLDFPKVNLMVVILAVSVIGAFAINLNFSDVIIMFFSGVLGYLMKRFDFPVTPLILALVLGYSIEDNFRKSLVFSGGSLDIFIKKPVSLVFLTLAMIILVAPFLRPWLEKRFRLKKKALS
ncbi:MAG TPA: C4-dicarboxylate ABC transporter permease [Peptococcaceae bacterium]|nr:C4-dicarboxylate ABC transporter permease [Peptococcaceae bacterium]